MIINQIHSEKLLTNFFILASLIDISVLQQDKLIKHC